MALFTFDEDFALLHYHSTLNWFLTRLMPAAPGDHAKVYLTGLVRCFSAAPIQDIGQLAQAAQMSADAVRSALSYWTERGALQMLGTDQYRYVPLLLSPAAQNVPSVSVMPQPAAISPSPAPEQARPQPTARTETVISPEAFAGKIRSYLAPDRELTPSELSDAYNWVTRLGFQPQAVYLIINFMKAVYGPGFYMTVASDLVADMVNKDIRTLEKARPVLSAQRQVILGAREVLQCFGLKDAVGNAREPSTAELRYYAAWLKEGFTPDAIRAACDETGKGTPSFAYLNEILNTMARQLHHGARSAQEVHGYFEDIQKSAAPLKEVIRTMNLRITVNQGTLAAYQRLTLMYPQEIILKAARICSEMNDASLATVNDMLARWEKEGLRTNADIDRYLKDTDQLNVDVRKVLDTLGVKTGAKNADRTKVRRWKDEYHLPLDMILHCAKHAADKDKPMIYLDRMLKEISQKGIRTIEAFEKDRAAFYANNGRSGRAGTKKVSRQQYEQREYPETQQIDLMDELMGTNGNDQ